MEGDKIPVLVCLPLAIILLIPRILIAPVRPTTGAPRGVDLVAKYASISLLGTDRIL